MLVGFGYDVHKLVPGRPLILGGVRIPYEKGLDGHSDADVLVHAIMDAMLGAAGLRDIGHQFPNSEAAYRGADSVALLGKVMELLRREGLKPINVDTTLLAEQPRIGPHAEKMRANIAGVLDLHPRRVSIKATTNEGMGFVGEGQGMAAYAVVLLEEVD